MIQLVFDAATRRRSCLAPNEVGYSQHEGAEQAAWDVEARTRRRHPPRRLPGGRLARELLRRRRSSWAVPPSRVSAATTRAAPPRPAAGRATIPSDPAQAHDGSSRGSPSRDAGASCSPPSSTGRPAPNLKTQWTEPIQWSQGWRDRELLGSDGERLRHRPRPTSSVARSAAGRGARAARDRPLAVPAGAGALASCSRSTCSRGRRGVRRPRSGSRIDVRGGRRSVGLVSDVRRQAAALCSASGSCSSRSRSRRVLQALLIHGTSVLGVETGARQQRARASS